MNELYKKTAIEVVNLLKRKTISSLEVVEHAISRIDAIDQRINALPIRCFERARKQTKSLNNISQTNSDMHLHGLPIAVKDYNNASGVSSIYGTTSIQIMFPIN